MKRRELVIVAAFLLVVVVVAVVVYDFTTGSGTAGRCGGCRGFGSSW
jgi:hypothetical protein